MARYSAGGAPRANTADVEPQKEGLYSDPTDARPLGLQVTAQEAVCIVGLSKGLRLAIKHTRKVNER